MKRLFKYYPEDFKDLPVKVIHMDLIFDVYDTYTNVKSKLKIKSLNSPLSKIELNAKNLEIISIFVENYETEYEYNIDENKIVIKFDIPVPPETELIVNSETICRPTKIYWKDCIMMKHLKVRHHNRLHNVNSGDSKDLFHVLTI